MEPIIPPSRDPLIKLYAALGKAQLEFQQIHKNAKVTVRMKTGGTYDFQYADLEEITSKTRPALVKHGLTFMQVIDTGEDNTRWLVSRLIHEDGGLIESRLPLGHSFSDVKDFGAQITYLRRYAKTAILDIAADADADDDGVEPEDMQARSESTSSAPAEPTTYSDAKFRTKLPQWEAAIRSGERSAEQILAFLKPLNPTAGQIARIKNIKTENN